MRLNRWRFFILSVICFNALAVANTGTLKISSQPLRCLITFRGKTYEKKRAVLEIAAIPAGLYPVEFHHAGKTIQKRARIHPGQTTIIFGSVAENNAAGRESSLMNERVDKRQPVLTAPRVPVAASLPPVAAVKGGYQSPGVAQPRSYFTSAAALFELAEIYRRARNPLRTKSRYNRALELYAQILRQYPQSPEYERALYGMGRIYETRHFRRYSAAVGKYKEVLAYNPASTTDASRRVSRLYTKGLSKEAANSLHNTVPTDLMGTAAAPLPPTAAAANSSVVLTAPPAAAASQPSDIVPLELANIEVTRLEAPPIIQIVDEPAN